MRVVHKFGGTSVRDARSISAVANIVLDQRRIGEPVVVVSAMAGVTDSLVEGARAAASADEGAYGDAIEGLRNRHEQAAVSLLEDRGERGRFVQILEAYVDRVGQLFRSVAVLGELTARTNDAVVCIGEQLSANLLAAVLRSRRVSAEAISATDLIVTDDAFGLATPLQPETDERIAVRFEQPADAAAIPVITGFIAATAQGVPTTLGRGGSDYSAAIIAAALDAAELRIWTDVDGILTADPNIVPSARVLRELSYGEAENLARFGAEVLHPRTIRPIIVKGVVLRILNSFHPSDPGTLIVANPDPARDHWPAIISATGLSLISVRVADDAWRLPMAACALQRLHEAGVGVLMFTQSYSERNLNLVVREVDRVHALKLLRCAFETDASWGVPGAGAPGGDEDDRVWSMDTQETVATVSVVGVPGWNQVGIASHTFSALGKHGVRVIAVAQAATQDSVSFCIPADQVTETVRALHRELGLENVPR